MDISKNIEVIERTIMRPMAEEIAQSIAIERGCKEHYVDWVTLNKTGHCEAHVVFILDKGLERETLVLHYSNEIN